MPSSGTVIDNGKVQYPLKTWPGPHKQSFVFGFFMMMSTSRSKSLRLGVFVGDAIPAVKFAA